MKKLLTTAILGLLVAYATFNVGVWYQTKRMLDEFKQATELELAFSHGWIVPSLSGEVTINNVVITLFRLRDPIPIGQVKLSFGSLTDMLEYLSPWALTEELKVPDSVELYINNAQIPLTDNWKNFVAEEQPGGNLFGLACGDINSIGVDEMRGMEYGTLTVNQQIGYDFDRREGLLRLTFDTHIEGIQHSSGVLELQGLTWPPALDAALPRLKKFRFLHEDLSYMKRLMFLCGKRANLDEPGFINATINKTKNLLNQAGIKLSPSLLNAYKIYLKGDGIVEILLFPTEPLDIGTLPFLPAEELAQSLGFSLQLNRITIPDAAFSADIEKLVAFLDPPEPEIVVEVKPEVVVVEPSLQPVEVDELKYYVGSHAQITQHTGKVISGTLKNVDDFQLTLERQVQRGVVSFQIKRKNIQEALVLR